MFLENTFFNTRIIIRLFFHRATFSSKATLNFFSSKKKPGSHTNLKNPRSPAVRLGTFRDFSPLRVHKPRRAFLFKGLLVPAAAAMLPLLVQPPRLSPCGFLTPPRRHKYVTRGLIDQIFAARKFFFLKEGLMTAHDFLIESRLTKINNNYCGHFLRASILDALSTRRHPDACRLSCVT